MLTVNSTKSKTPVLHHTFADGTDIYSIVDIKNHATRLLVSNDVRGCGCFSAYETEEYEDLSSGEIYIPQPFHLVRESVITMPSKSTEYWNAGDLHQEVKSFLQRYLRVSEPDMEVIASYVLMTWTYGSFEKIPYLRFIGPHGSGKSRALNLLRVISYYSINLGTSQTPAGIYRTLGMFKEGTMFLDEANYRFSNKEDELTKILLSGYERGKPVTRMNTSTNKQEFFPTFGPKVLANHVYFDDIALESRIITVKMFPTSDPTIPRTLPNPLDWPEAENLRDMLLNFKMNGPYQNAMRMEFPELLNFECRTAEIFTPLVATRRLTNVPADILNVARNHEQELSIMVDNDPETLIARRALELMDKNIYSAFVMDIANDILKKHRVLVSPRKVSGVLRSYGAISTKWGKGYKLDFNSLKRELIEARFCAID